VRDVHRGEQGRFKDRMTKLNYSSEEMRRYFNDPAYRKQILMKKAAWSRRRTVIFSVAAIALVVFTWWYVSFIVSGLPTFESLENPRPDLATKIYSADGEVIDQIYYRNRTWISLDSLPKGLPEALIATEDKQFYHHWGVDVTRIFKAMVKNIIALNLDREGASTITQQLSRNLYNLKSRGDKGFFNKITRKFRELVTSVQLERNFTKREILELYLNVSYFGRGASGIESAAQTYFDESASQLTVPVYTLLIGMLKGPGYYDPINNLDRALKRRDIVLGQMVKDGVITQASADIYRKEIPEFKLADANLATGIAPHFTEWIRKMLIKKAEQYNFDPYRDGLRVYTTLDSRMQRDANRAVEEHLDEFQRAFDTTWNWNKYPEILQQNIEKFIRDAEPYRIAKTLEAKDSIANLLRTNPAFIDTVKKLAKMIEVGFVCIDPHNGHIMAMVGGRNFRAFRYGLNHVTQIHRQPGSAFKPFVYTVAIDNGYPVTYELLNQPVTIPMPDGTLWQPGNFDGDIGGKYTIREALTRSINLIAVRAIQSIAPPDQVSIYAHRMGIHSPVPAYASIALGTPLVTPLEITSAFGVYANEGVLVDPIAILKIEDKDGNVIENDSPEKHEALSKETAYIMTNLLEGVVNDPSGTGHRVRYYLKGVPAAGKTGTTNDFADAWFVGFTPQLAAGVWVGFDDNQIKFGTSNGQGGRAAAPIWGKFMASVYGDPKINMPDDDFVQPPGVVTDTVCVDTKMKAREWCPNKMTEIFNAKYPLPLCNKHTSAHWNEGRDPATKSKISW
jgi:penicillin-binding protein 1A